MKYFMLPTFLLGTVLAVSAYTAPTAHALEMPSLNLSPSKLVADMQQHLALLSDTFVLAQSDTSSLTPAALALVAKPTVNVSPVSLHHPYNLIANPSFEEFDVTTGLPLYWNRGAWGTHDATFTYPVAGAVGERAAHVSMTQHTSGDAKWYHEAVQVKPNTTYTFTDQYRSDASSRVVVALYDAQGSVSYRMIGPMALSSGNVWQTFSAQFETLADTDSVTVLHVLESVGSLTIDDVSLMEVIVPTFPSDEVPRNHSVEVADGDLPYHWKTGKWGINNPTFEYVEGDGHDGSRSVKVTMSNYVSGDAKWMFTPTPLTNNKEYRFTAWYKTNAAPHVVVQYEHTDGSYTYKGLVRPQPSTNAVLVWQPYNSRFHVPDGVANVSVFFFLAENGWVQTDDYDITEETVPTFPPTEIPSNQSVEVVDGLTPYYWAPAGWGTNDPQYEYVEGDGHDGSRSVKVTMSNYVSGDAKWVFTPLPLPTEKDYRFTAWYKSNVTPQVVVQYQHTDGRYTFHGMPRPQPGGNAETVWQEYSDTFSVPTGVANVSVFFFLAENGWVQTDDYAIEEYAQPSYNRPLVSITFDDGFEENVDTALPILAEHDFLSTYCFATQFVEGQPEQIAKALQIRDAGHEICSHTVTHPFLTTLDDQQLAYELSHSKAFLEELTGAEVASFASPYGNYDQRVNEAIAQYYETHRTVDEGYNTKDNLARYALRVQNMTPNTTIEQYRAWVDKAIEDKVWLIFLYHVIDDSDLTAYDTSTEAFREQMAYLASTDVTVLTWKDALAEVSAQ